MNDDPTIKKLLNLRLTKFEYGFEKQRFLNPWRISRQDNINRMNRKNENAQTNTTSSQQSA
jgi:hypothetical protein